MVGSRRGCNAECGHPLNWQGNWYAVILDFSTGSDDGSNCTELMQTMITNTARNIPKQAISGNTEQHSLD